MSNLAQSIRPHWVSGLSNISGIPNKNIKDWFSKLDFLMEDPLEEDQFTLKINNPSLLLSAYAFECNNLAIASFESIVSIKKVNLLPKSTAWPIIKSYYSAFFSANAILRMLGVSFVQIDSSQIDDIHNLADIFNVRNNKALQAGYYKCTYNGQTKKMDCSRMAKSSSGSHVVRWNSFYEEINNLKNKILIAKNYPLLDQQVASRLIELSDNLCGPNASDGAWLSYIRNEVNYRLQFGSWFPYKNGTDYDFLFRDALDWKKDAMTINLRFSHGKELKKFQSTCNFVVSLCRELIIDMAETHKKGKSFHVYGSLSFLSHIGEN